MFCGYLKYPPRLSKENRRSNRIPNKRLRWFQNSPLETKDISYQFAFVVVHVFGNQIFITCLRLWFVSLLIKVMVQVFANRINGASP